MPWTPSTEPGRRLKAQLDAEMLLLKLDQAEPVAQHALHLHESADTSLKPAEVAFWQSEHRRLYRKALGIDPEQRDVLRAKLHEIKLTGQRAVADILAELQPPTT